MGIGWIAAQDTLQVGAVTSGSPALGTFVVGQMLNAIDGESIEEMRLEGIAMDDIIALMKQRPVTLTLEPASAAPVEEPKPAVAASAAGQLPRPVEEEPLTVKQEPEESPPPEKKQKHDDAAAAAAADVGFSDSARSALLSKYAGMLSPPKRAVQPKHAPGAAASEGIQLLSAPPKQKAKTDTAGTAPWPLTHPLAGMAYNHALREWEPSADAVARGAAAKPAKSSGAGAPKKQRRPKNNNKDPNHQAQPPGAISIEES